MDSKKILTNRPSKQFTYVNLIGWGIAAVVNTILQYFSNNLDFYRAMFGVIPIAWCFLITTGLRYYWGSRNIYALGNKKLVLILIPHSLIATLLIDVVGIGNVVLIRNFEPDLLALYVRNYVSMYPIIVLWIAVYFSIIHTQNLRRREVDNLRLQNALQSAQLSNLRSQLNPHFLFNALNNIKSLVREDGEKAREMISSLTDILRYSLNSGMSQMVTVQEEISFVKEYLDLEHLHMEERLRYEINLDEHARQCRIPPMMIQMLVENAIKHGISQLPGGGNIAVDVAPVEGLLEIRVSNTGHLSAPSRQDGNGLGILNIKSRLKMMYGENSAFDIRENRERVIATLTMPIQK